MNRRAVLSIIACASIAAWPAALTVAADSAGQSTAHESRIPVAGAQLYAREIGKGPAIIVLHGGPDFDHRYLVPDLDRLADAYRLIYYDQRGRGESAAGVRPEDVTLESEMTDLDAVRKHFGLGSAIVLGHSWGTVLALEYARGHPQAVSHLILLNPAPGSAADLALFRKAYIEKLGPDLDRQRQIAGSDAYKNADPAAVIARYRLHFKPALAREQDYETLMNRMGEAFIHQGSGGILKARAVEDRLMVDTWNHADYDVLSQVRTLQIPTLVLTGDHDFIPPVVAEHTAQALPNAQLVELKDCGHFSYMERPTDVRKAIDRFLHGQRPN